MKSRLKRKKMILPSKINKNIDFEKKVEKAIQQTNKRIKSINKKYKGTTYTWSINKLKNKVGNKFFKNNRITVPKRIKPVELIKLYKDIESFLNDKQSTKSGVKEVQKKAKQTIKNELFENDITDEDVEGYYRMFEDNDYTAFLRATGLTPSEFWVIIDDAKKSGDTEDSFLSRLEQYVTIPDEYVRNLAIRIYNKYVK